MRFPHKEDYVGSIPTVTTKLYTSRLIGRSPDFDPGSTLNGVVQVRSLPRVPNLFTVRLMVGFEVLTLATKVRPLHCDPNFGRSSSGRTSGSDPDYLGSNPSLPANSCPCRPSCYERVERLTGLHAGSTPVKGAKFLLVASTG